MNKRQLMKWRETYKQWTLPCTGEGLKLAVHFDEKDYVKRMGGRWHPDDSGGKDGYWWMPSGHLDTHCVYDSDDTEMYLPDGTVLDFLNKYKMIQGQYGKQDPESCQRAIRISSESPPQSYQLFKVGGYEPVLVEFYAELGICVFSANPPRYKTAEEGRKYWDGLVSEGFNRTELVESS